VIDSLWIKPTDTLSSNFIGITTLHVSGSLSTNHQFFAIHRHWYNLCNLLTECYQAQDVLLSLSSSLSYKCVCLDWIPYFKNFWLILHPYWSIVLIFKLSELLNFCVLLCKQTGLWGSSMMTVHKFLCVLSTSSSSVCRLPNIGLLVFSVFAVVTVVCTRIIQVPCVSSTSTWRAVWMSVRSRLSIYSSKAIEDVANDVEKWVTSNGTFLWFQFSRGKKSSSLCYFHDSKSIFQIIRSEL
jgi:hypothetical protein